MTMRQFANPQLAPGTLRRGFELLNSPRFNKGTSFTEQERGELGLTGLLPAVVTTLEEQVKNAWLQYDRLQDALSKQLHLTALQDRNEVLFYRLFAEHLREMIPVIDNRTDGVTARPHYHERRRPQGVFLSIDHPQDIEKSFANLNVGAGDIDLVLATDGEKVPGVGDWGIGGIEASISKLAIYTAAGGIDPSRTIPVMLDVGTNRQSFLEDPAYSGNRHARVRGKRYDDFVDAYVKVVTRLFPHALLQWEDFAPGNGRRILELSRQRACTFSDDMQGTGTITLAAAISAVRVCGIPLRSQRVVIFGAGTSGIGVADQLRDAMVREGLSKDEATARFWCVDRHGLLTTGMTEQLRDFQVGYARPSGGGKGRNLDADGLSLAEVVRRVAPTMLIGSSAVSGSFTEAIVKDMAAHTERPIIVVLSKPSARAEANPADLIAWTSGRALLATGSAAEPVTYKGVTHVVAQVNNAMVYPGLCLGAIVARASRISDGMFVAAASAVSSLVTVRQPGASLLPHIDDLRSVAVTVAVAVAEAAEAEGLAGARLGEIVQQVQDAMWQPEYSRIQAE